MPRITKDGPRDAASTVDLDTAERQRPKGLHEPMHEMRGSEADARNQPRTTAADYEYRLPTNLDAPPPRPGYRQRWVRSEFRTESDNLNWQQKLREGWRPRDPSSVSEDQYYFGDNSKGGQAVIRVGGMILMEIPEQAMIAKRRAIDEATRRQEQGVMQEAEKASKEGAKFGYSPIVGEEVTRVQTGRRPNTLAD